MTLIELIVAMLILTVGVLGTISVAASVSRAEHGGMRQTLAAGIAQARLDSLSSIGCSNLEAVSGAATQRGIKEVWVVTDGFNVKNISITITLPERKNPIVYTTVLPCRN